MSKHIGQDNQPLHTDGAHLIRPPDFVVLIAETPNTTPTYVLRPQLSYREREDLAHGVFKVTTGKTSFLAAAIETGRLRFDPLCMEPLDARARKATDVLSATDDVHAHHWNASEHNMLVIDNRAALHARSSVSKGDEKRTLIRYSIEEKRS